MSILKTIKCNICGASQLEATQDAGWPAWGQIMGVGDPTRPASVNPHLCPRCLASVAEFLEKLEGGK